MSLRLILPGLLLLMPVSMMSCGPSKGDGNSGNGNTNLQSPSPNASLPGASPCPSPAPDPNRKITLMSPCDGAKVAPRAFVEGVVADSNAKVWVVIHPMIGADYWVQPIVTVRDGGKWRVLCYFGEPIPQHSGKSYQVMAFANAKGNLSEGQVLGDWPEAESKSQVVEVTRE